MEKQNLETKKIVHNNISYLQYDLAKDQAKTSFFDISDINAIKELRQEGLQKMHFLNLYSIFWFYSGEGTHIVDFDEYEIGQGTVFFLSPKRIRAYRNLSNVEGVAMCFPEDFLLKYAKFVQMVEDNYIESHAVKDYIEKLGVSQTTLNQYTQQYAKTTPLKIINNRIILEAKRLLRYSTTRTKQIAFYLGFKDDSYFIKLFKRNVGMSPVEFRQKKK